MPDVFHYSLLRRTHRAAVERAEREITTIVLAVKGVEDDANDLWAGTWGVPAG